MNVATIAPAPAPRAVIYTRISVDDEEKREGVQRQAEDLKREARRRAARLVDVLEDNDLSGSGKVTRPAFDTLIEMINTGQVDLVLAADLDRLSRGMRPFVRLYEACERARIMVAWLGGQANFASGEGLLELEIRASFAREELRKIRGRTKRAKQQAREDGEPMGGARPFGWKAIPRLDEAGRPVLNRRGLQRMTWRSDQPDPVEAQLIRNAVKDLLAGASLSDIARQWNAKGIGQPQTGRANWEADVIRQVVGNPRHAGLVGYRERQVRTDDDGTEHERYLRPHVITDKAKWKAIVDRKEWTQLQALLDQRGAAGRMPRRRSLLTGLVVCGRCGTVMSRSASRGKNSNGAVRRVWRCPSISADPDKGRRHKRGCGGVSIDAEGLEQHLVEAMMRRADTASLAKMVHAQGADGKQAARLVRELDELRRRETAAAESYAAGRITVTAFEKTSAMLHSSQEDVGARLGKLTSTSVAVPYIGQASLLRKTWPNLSMDQQRAIIGTILGQVEVAPAYHPGRPRFDEGRVTILKRRAA